MTSFKKKIKEVKIEKKKKKKKKREEEGGLSHSHGPFGVVVCFCFFPLSFLVSFFFSFFLFFFFKKK
jgi:hypothetical protein